MADIKFGRRPREIESIEALESPPPKPKKKKRKPRKRWFSAVLLNKDKAPPVYRKLKRGDKESLVRPGDRYGRATVTDNRSNVDGYLVYSLKCDCGHQFWSFFSSLRAMEKLNTGCMRSTCTVTPGELKPWVDWDVATHLQWSQMVNGFRDQTDNEWGGEFIEGLPSSDNGYENFCLWLEGQEGVNKKKWWIRRIDDKSPWADWNTTVSSKPDKALFDQGKLMLDYYGAVMSASEWAEILGCEPNTLITALQDRDATDIIESLL